MSPKRGLSLLLALAMLLSLLPSALATTVGPHTHQWSDPDPQQPWCTIPGGYYHVCNICYEGEFVQTSPPLGHDWSAWTYVRQGTCAKENSGLHVHPKDEFVPTCQPSQRHGSSSGYCEETEYDSERKKELKTRDSPA